MHRHLTIWNVGLLCVMLVGAFLLLTGWDFGLPVYESIDEVVNLDEIYALRGLSGEALSKPGYPPGILYVNYLAQNLAELSTGQSAWDQPCAIIRNVRLIGVVANLLTALLVALSARKLSTDAGGLLAALAWLVAPMVLQQSQYGFPQVYEGLLYMLVLYMALLALEKHNPRYALLCTLAGLGSVIFKYATFPVLVLGVGTALWEMRTDRQRWLRVLAVQLSLIAITALLLVAFGEVTAFIQSDHMETQRFLQGGLQQMLTRSLMLYHLSNAFGLLGWSLALFTVLLLVGTIAFWLQSTGWQRLGWVGALFLVFSHTLFLGAYITKTDVGRNLLTVSSAVAVISAVAIVAVGRALGQLVRQSGAAYAVVGAISLLWLGPQIVGAWEWVQYRRLPVTYAAMVAWTDQQIPEENMLVSDDRPFIRQGSCYRGNWRQTHKGDITDQPIERWLAQDIYYVELEQERVDELRSSPAGQDYLDQMTLLKQFPEPGEAAQWRTFRRGFDPAIAVYKLWAVEPDVPTQVVFGDQIRLLGYNLDPRPVSPGDSLTLQFYWQPTRTPGGDYHVFIHLALPNDARSIIAQADGPLARSALRITSTWNDPEETFISREFSLAVPDDLPPGEYQLRVGVYDWRTSERLFVEADRDYISFLIEIVDE